MQDTPAPAGTDGADYTHRLQRLGGARWKRVIDAQAPYRWNIRRLDLGRTLDVGCGIGRNLAHLDGNGVGVDHNASSILACRALGLEAYTIDDFLTSEHARPDAFDAMLAAHLVEHLPEPDAREVVGMYLPFVRRGAIADHDHKGATVGRSCAHFGRLGADINSELGTCGTV